MIASEQLRCLVICEYSGAVRDELTALGHFARSVDLLPTESLKDPVKFRGDFGCMNHPTYQPDCEDCEYDEPWCHEHGMYAYECICLGPTEDEAEYADSCEEGARHLSGDAFAVEDIESYDLVIAHPPCTRLTNSGVRWLHERNLWKELDAAAAFFRQIALLPVPCIGIENPIPHKYAIERFGHLPGFVEQEPGSSYSQIVQPWMFGHGETKATCFWLKNLPPLQPTEIVTGREQRMFKLPPSPDRAKIRSKTYPGIARAIAQQWSVAAMNAKKRLEMQQRRTAPVTDLMSNLQDSLDKASAETPTAFQPGSGLRPEVIPYGLWDTVEGKWIDYKGLSDVRRSARMLAKKLCKTRDWPVGRVVPRYFHEGATNEND